jgi:lysine-specific demethylase/histidyl-hydroxylase NO66
MKRSAEQEIHLTGDSRAAKRKRKNKEKKLQKLEEHESSNNNKKKLVSEFAKKFFSKKENDNLAHEGKANIAESDFIVVAKEDYDSNAESLSVAKHILKVPLSDVPDSGVRARSLFEWMISPVDVEQFYENYWENKPLCIERVNGRKYYNGWSCLEDLRKWIVDDGATEGSDFEILPYKQKNSELSALKGEKLWHALNKEKASVRFYSAPNFDSNILKLFSSLEEEFTSMVRGNLDLSYSINNQETCHSLNFDAFIMQIEGMQKVAIFAPENEDSICSRIVQEVPLSELGRPIAEFCLQSGDFMYLPKGFLAHFSVPKKSDYSLSLRFGVNELNTVADLLGLIVNEAVEEVIQTNVTARKSLPKNFTSILGVVNADNVQNELRDSFVNTLDGLLMQVKNTAQDFIDAGVDQISKKYLSYRWPFNHPGKKKFKISLDSKFAIVRKDVARLVLEEDKARLYHCLNNSFDSINKSLAEEPELALLEFDIDDAGAIEQVLFSYPKDAAIQVKDLEMDSAEAKIRLVHRLAHAGIVEIF